MLPECLEAPIIQYAHTSLGRAGVDKCVWEINQSFHLKNAERKMCRFIESCDICQRVKHPNRSLDMQVRNHVPSKPGELCSFDLYGPLPTERGGIRCILVCFEVFSKYVILYPIKTATTKTCLNKLVNHYFWKYLNVRLYIQIIERNFIPHYGREPCKNMMLKFDTPLSDTRKAIDVKDA